MPNAQSTYCAACTDRRSFYYCTFRCSRLSVALLFPTSPDLCLAPRVRAPYLSLPAFAHLLLKPLPILLTLHFSKTTTDGRRTFIHARSPVILEKVSSNPKRDITDQVHLGHPPFLDVMCFWGMDR